jgi:hypothetical protein
VVGDEVSALARDFDHFKAEKCRAHMVLWIGELCAKGRIKAPTWRVDRFMNHSADKTNTECWSAVCPHPRRYHASKKRWR